MESFRQHGYYSKKPRLIDYDIPFTPTAVTLLLNNTSLFKLRSFIRRRRSEYSLSLGRITVLV